MVLPESGLYRVFADFAIEGEPLTLGADLDTPGNYEPRQLPDPAGVARVDGYEVPHLIPQCGPLPALPPVCS